jgi:two-component system cell cycle response regulator
MRILICDDNKDLRYMLTVLIESSDRNAVVETAETGEDCLNKATIFYPDIVLLDLKLPKMNGYEVCSKLKSDPHLYNTGVIMITGLGDGGELKGKALVAGADAFLGKPVDRATLMAQIKLVYRARRGGKVKDNGLKHLDELTHKLFNKSSEG